VGGEKLKISFTLTAEVLSPPSGPRSRPRH
jgi:hypothetical protein